MKRIHVYSHVAHMIKATPQRFFHTALPEELQEQWDSLVRTIIREDTAEMTARIIKWENKQR